MWTSSLIELSVIEDSFDVDKTGKLQGKTILDVGTDGVKPLYISLKYEPKKIIGISDDLSQFSFASNLEQASRYFSKTEIKLEDCSWFSKERLNEILAREKQNTFDFVLVSKTLHHLRKGKCIKKHKCREDEKCCIYEFEPEKIFQRLLKNGKRVIIYENYFPQEKDEDKVRGRGGYFTVNEWKRILTHLAENYSLELIRPLRRSIGKEEVESATAKLRQADYICFYVEKTKEE